jgi:hypothetical protein
LLIHILLAFEVGVSKEAGEHEHEKEITIVKTRSNGLVYAYDQKNET